MKFGEAIKSVFKNYANFRGRARRSEFWYFYLFNVIVNIALSIFSAFSNVLGVVDPEAQLILSLLFGLPSMIYSLAVFLPSMAVTVRRLHDIGKSGWYYLFPLIPLGAIVILAVLAFIVSAGTGGSSAVGIVMVVLYVIAIIVMIAFCVVLIVWLCRDSQPGENKWGPNPKEIASEESNAAPQNPNQF